MRKAIATLAALLLLLASPAWGVWGLGSGQLMSKNIKNSQTSWAPTIAQTVDVGNVAICILAVDNISTGGGETSDHTSVTDDASNTWVKAVEFSNAANANQACTMSMWVMVATTELTATSAITFNISSAKSAWAVTCKEFTMSVGDEVTERDQVTRELDNLAPDSLDSGTVASIQHLWIHGICGETSDTGYSSTSGWTEFLTSGSTTSGGGSAGNMASRADYKIITATTENNNPNWADAPDHARGMIAFEETTFVAPSRSRVIDIQ